MDQLADGVSGLRSRPGPGTDVSVPEEWPLDGP